MRNLSMLTDLYELTMGNGYLRHGMEGTVACFDLFFRSVPDGGGFAIAAGLEKVIDYLLNLRFSPDDVAYLRSKGLFDEAFLDYLSRLRFTGDLYAVPEGTPVFPHEPLLTVRAPVIEAQLIETFLLLAVNHQSLIATKANRVVRAARGRPVWELGSRRAQGADGAVDGARAAYIGGCAGTACALAGELYGIPPVGTMAHSWVQMFESEYAAFRAYLETNPAHATLLVDTYDTLNSGVPNAIRAFKDAPASRGRRAIRLDSGDIADLSIKARELLDEAGLTDCRIIASNALDEFLIHDLLSRGARIDAFGVGERLITAKSSPVFGGVYKLAAVENARGELVPKIKVSENPSKITHPHLKRLYRLYDRSTGMAAADELRLWDEPLDAAQPDPGAAWERGDRFTARELLTPVFRDGTLVYERPSLETIRLSCRRQVGLLEDGIKRLEAPCVYPVRLSERLARVRRRMLEEARGARA